MPRKNLIRQNEFPYHVTIRTINKNWFFIPMYKMWELCYECLSYALGNARVEIHCFVLMGNHYHLLVTTPQSNLDKFMEYFNKQLSSKIKQHSGAENHKFANRYHWTIIDSRSYLFNVYRYIYQNPIHANLCDLCIDYPYSSLRFSPAQIRKLGIRVHISYFKYREWMEKRNDCELNEHIRIALKKNKFRISPRAGKLVNQKLNSGPTSN